jgi:hypothetical protein
MRKILARSAVAGREQYFYPECESEKSRILSNHKAVAVHKKNSLGGKIQ